jgi:hypothetical protein
MMGPMIKVHIDRATDNTFFVEEGATVNYADDVVEVLNYDDEVIAVFRGWVYALPATEDEMLAAQEELETDEELDEETAEAEFEVPDIVSYARANNHAGHELLDDETVAPGE